MTCCKNVVDVALLLIYNYTKQKGQKLVFWSRTILERIFFFRIDFIINVNLSLILIGTITNTIFFGLSFKTCYLNDYEKRL